MIATITRLVQDRTQTLGCLTIVKGNKKFRALTLEKGWRDNENNISCIPEGTYEVVLEYSPAFDELLYELKGVPNRSEIKFHSANYNKQLRGCIALGDSLGDINKDGYLDVLNSRKTMKKFHTFLQGVERFELTIEKCLE